VSTSQPSKRQIAEAFQNLVDTWSSSIASYPGAGGNPSRFHLLDNYLHLLNAKQPYVATRCLGNNLTTLVNVSETMSFPNKQSQWNSCNGYWATSDISLEVLPLNIQLDSESYRITWFNLPQRFTNGSPEAINTPHNSKTWASNNLLYACAIYPSWEMATINTTQDLSDRVVSTSPLLS
jgi:hypothetical protein